MSNNVRGSIKTNNNTKNHKSALEKLGYTVREGSGVIEVEGTEFLRTLDLSTNPAAALREVTKERKLLTYSTKVTFEGGKVLASVPMCLALGALCKRSGIPVNLSCLVVRPEGGKAASAPAEAPEARGEVAEGWEDLF